MAPKTVRRSVVAAPAGRHLVARDESPIQLLKDLNTRLLKEILLLRSELASSGAELRRVKEQIKAERAVASEAMEKLNKKVEEKNLKTEEVAGLKMQLEETIKGNKDIVLKCNKLKLQSNDLAAENEHMKHALKAKDAMIEDLSQNLDLIQSVDRRRGTWNWMFPLATVIIAAGALAYAAKVH